MDQAQVRNYEDGEVRISTPTPCRSVNAMAALGLSALYRQYSAGPSIAYSSERLVPLGIPIHEPCFVTKRSGYALQKSYLVNAPREDRRLKAALARFLENLHVVVPGFDFDSASNLIKLDRNLYFNLNELGFGAITCSKTTLQAMLKVVEDENKKYDELAGRYFRLFEFSEAPFSSAQYELVLLLPDYFLPKGSNIVMHTQDPNDPPRLVGKLYVAAEDGALREGRESTSPRFPAFTPPHLREDIDRVNPLLVILRAHTVFQQFRTLGDEFMQRLYPEYAELIDLTTQLVDAIYHAPIAQRAGIFYGFAQFPTQTGGSGAPDHDEDSDTDTVYSDTDTV